MNEYQKRDLERLLANPESLKEGFALREEGLWVVANLGGIGMFNARSVRLTERSGVERIGYLDVVSLNGIEPFESSQLGERSTERVQQAKLRLSYLDGDGEARTQDYEALTELQALVVVS